MSRRQTVPVSSSQRSSSRLASSNSGNTERGSRKRTVEEVVIDEENEAPNTEVPNESEEIIDSTRKYDVNTYRFQPNEKDIHKFEALAPDVQAQCIKAVCRLFVMKGARKESITRENVRTVLNEIDSDYKKHAVVVLRKAQQQLITSIGYVIVSGDSILGVKKSGKNDEYYVTNSLRSPKLMKMLTQAKRYNHFIQVNGTQRHQYNNGSSSSSSQPPTARSRRDSSSSRPNYNEDVDQLSENEDEGPAVSGGGGTTIAFLGFLVLVCGIVYTAPQKRISCEDLLAHIRKVDPRFPTRLTSAKEASVCPVPELEEQFLVLIKRLQREHYLVGRKPEGDKGEENVFYSLGPRFYLDIGRKELMLKYFELMDQPIDEYIMKEIEEDSKKEVDTGVGGDDGETPAADATAVVARQGATASSSSSSSRSSRK